MINCWYAVRDLSSDLIVFEDVHSMVTVNCKYIAEHGKKVYVD